jgi:general secretion pathway protein H
VTLVELLITVAIIGVAVGLTMVGAGVSDSARLRRSSVMIASAVRVAYGHANASSKVARLVFDLDARTVSLEEATGQSGGAPMKIAKNDMTGGAAAATEAERKAVEDADQILKGPRAPRPTFQKIATYGFDTGKSGPGKELEKNIRFLQIETSHQDEIVKTGRAYLYFWPGGQTERAAIQVYMVSSSLTPAEADVMTILVSPLTGKAELRRGKLSMPRPRDDAEASERRDTGF